MQRFDKIGKDELDKKNSKKFPRFKKNPQDNF